jgi:hypothetical protein
VLRASASAASKAAAAFRARGLDSAGVGLEPAEEAGPPAEEEEEEEEEERWAAAEAGRCRWR